LRLSWSSVTNWWKSTRPFATKKEKRGERVWNRPFWNFFSPFLQQNTKSHFTS
jgi:hypothetical protein